MDLLWNFDSFVGSDNVMVQENKDKSLMEGILFSRRFIFTAWSLNAFLLFFDVVILHMSGCKNM